MSQETERRIKILDFIREKTTGERERVNKSDVMRRLQEYSRMNTTHKTIVDLIKEGKIKPVKDNPRSQTHYLVINDKNEFNKIYDYLLEIESLIDKMDEPIHKISKDFEVTQYPSFMDELTNLIRNFQTPYEEAINIMLMELMARIDNKIPSEKDKQILYSRILQLQQKVKLQVSGQGDIKVIEQLDSIISKHLKHVKRSSFTGDRHINVDLANDLITFIEKFKKEFIVDAEQKTAEPHEK